MKYLDIRPKSKLKFYFWTDPYRLPKDRESLNYFHNHEIQFVIALGKHTMKEKCYNKIRRLTDYNIGINVCLLDKDFAHLDNSHNFIKLYNIFKKSPIFGDVNDIYIDAEISNKYRNFIRNSTWNKKIAYVFNSYPNKKEYQTAIRDYNRLVNLVQDDAKKFGIIRAITATYQFDKLTRNIPFKEIHEDITVIMVYRVPEGKEKEYADYWFYRIAKKEGKNIFLGDIKDGYKSLRKDITICSYLNKKRVYIYDYYGFKKYCKIGDLKPYKHYRVNVDALETIKQATISTGKKMAEKFLKFLK